ncbi:MAG: lanthionine synthetase [Catenulispora sp.]|nr:lanthionine synthetase [Catenulispora sp.]
MSEQAAMDLATVLLEDAIKTADEESENFSLQLDVALCLLERERAGGPPGDPTAYLGRAIEIIRGREETGPWIYGGAAQLGWVANTLVRRGLLKALNAEWIDEYVLSSARDYPESLDVDLLQGVIGLGVYGLSTPSPSAREAITAAVVDVIGKRADSDQDGMFLRRSSPYRASLGRGYVLGQRDLGVAHGTMGVAAYLAMVARSGLSPAPQALELLTPMARWLLAMAVPDDETTVFGAIAESRWHPTRSAWCYGDPGSSIALALVAESLQEQELKSACEEHALRAATAAAGRPSERSGVTDASVCHGAAGLCYFGRKWSQTFDLDSMGYAQEWYSWIEQRRIGGRLSYLKPTGQVQDASFLEGDCGTAAVLFYLASGKAPLWEELLLMARPEDV